MRLCVETLSALARRGSLPAAERRQLELALDNSLLERHLHEVGRAFDRQVVRSSRDEQLVGRAVDGALERLVGSRAAQDASRALVRGSGARRRLGLVGCLWAFGLGSAAAAGYWGHSLVDDVSRARPVAARASESAVREAKPASRVGAGAGRERAVQVASSASDSPAGERSESPVEPAREDRVRAAAPQPVSTASTSSDGAASETATSLFARANAARRQGNTSLAIALYGGLRQRFPRSEEAALACVSLGHLYLMQGASEFALGHFSAYLVTASSGALAQEALRGKATALERLGRRSEEVVVWRELLARFPHSVFRDLALERLQSSP